VTPFHIFATTVRKYDTRRNLAKFDKKELEAICKKFVRVILGRRTYKPLTFSETKRKILKAETRKSSPGPVSKSYERNVGEVICSSGFEDTVESILKDLRIINVIGKFERKTKNKSSDIYGNSKSRRPDSRLIFYTDCTYRFIEEIYFGEMFDNLVNPVLNKFALGHSPYTSYGDITDMRFREKSFALARDISLKNSKNKKKCLGSLGP
jgi:hypothetical protein